MLTPLLILKQNLLFNHGSRSLAAPGAAVNAHFPAPAGAAGHVFGRCAAPDVGCRSVS